MDSRKDEQGKKRRRKWPIVLICIFLVIGIAVGAVYAVFHHYFSMLGSLESIPTLPGAAMPAVSVPVETNLPEPAQTENLEQMQTGSPKQPQTESPGQAQTEAPEPAQTQSPEMSPIPTQEPEQEEPAEQPTPRDEAWELDEALRRNLEIRSAESDQYPAEVFNVLVIGLDASSDSMTGRADTILLLSINKQTKQMLFTSFLRDIYVSIPGWGNSRLDNAYAFGGADLLKQTIQANFGITVDRCMLLNFYIVVDLIDALGGIDLDLTAEEIAVMRDYISLQNVLLGRQEDADILSEYDAGTVHVNGNQALAYTRISSVGSDFARTGRQRVVINKCLDQVKNMGLVEVSGLASTFLPRIYTDLTEGDCANMIMMLLDLGSYQIGSLTIPMEGTYRGVNISGTSVIGIDFDVNVEAWRDTVSGMAGR